MAEVLAFPVIDGPTDPEVIDVLDRALDLVAQVRAGKIASLVYSYTTEDQELITRWFVAEGDASCIIAHLRTLEHDILASRENN